MTTPRAEESVGLPFDPWTVAIGLRRRWRSLALCVGISIGAGLAMGLLFGTQTYMSTTVLLNRAAASPAVSDIPPDSVSLPTLMSMVKVRPNLELARTRLHLEKINIGRIGAAIDVRVQKNTGLLFIEASWPTAIGAARLANTVRDVFLERQRRLRYADEFTIVNHEFERRNAESNQLDAQVANSARVMEQLQQRATHERTVRPASEGLSNLAIRVDRLRHLISDDQTNRANALVLQRRAADLARAEQMRDLRIISPVEFDSVHTEYERQKALTVDTDETKSWREELTRLQQGVLPSNATATSGETLLQDAMAKELDVEFRRVAVRARLDQLRVARAEISRLLADPGMKPPAQERDPAGFTVISAAVPEPLPASSTRKPIAIAVVILSSLLACSAVVVRQLADSRIKSEREMKVRIRAESLGVLPKVEGTGSAVVAALSRGDAGERARLAALRLRSMMPAHGARIVITGAVGREGATTAVAALAAALARNGERVLVIDARTNARTHAMVDAGSDVASLLGAVPHGHALAEYLRSNDAAAVEGLFLSTASGGVYCVADTAPLEPQLLGSAAMRGLLERASHCFDVVLIESAPALPYADTALLMPMVHAGVLVVRTRTLPARDLVRAVDRLTAAGGPRAATLLSLLAPPYLEPLGQDA